MKKINYLVVLVITSLIFLTGMWVGNEISVLKLDNIAALQQDLSVNSAAIGLQKELLRDNICSVDVFDITNDRFELGRKIAQLEGQLGFDNELVLRLKNEYSILNVQQFLLVEEQKEKCGTGVTPILFFYDNIGELEDSRTQGYILDYVYKTHPKDVVIYSFDINVRNPAVDTLLDLCDVSGAPTLVVNEKAYEEVLVSEELFSILGIAA